MADPSTPYSGQSSRAEALALLAQLPIDLAGLPSEIRVRLEERARYPERRLVVGRYVIIGELGRGGMGLVYEAWDPGIERRVAIKTMDPDLVPEEDREEVVERFRRETKIVGRLQHPSIVTIFDYGEDREPPPVGGGLGASRLFYYVMEYLEGQALSRVLRDRRTIPDLQAIRIVADVLDALHVTHKAGVVHRDIKPSNIFLRKGVQAVLLDFGIAKTTSVALTRHGQILGTPSFLAPERLREKEKPVDGRSDIFSLGILLFTMIVGEPPFIGDDIYEVIDKIAKAEHPKLARTTPSGQALSRVLDRMLAKRPEDRYATADEAAVALRQVERMMLEAERSSPSSSLLSEPPNALEAQATEVSHAFQARPSKSEDDTGRARLDSGLERVVDEVEAASRASAPGREPPAAPRSGPPPIPRPATPNPVRTVVASAPRGPGPEETPEEISAFGAEPTFESKTDPGDERQDFGPTPSAEDLTSAQARSNGPPDDGDDFEEERTQVPPERTRLLPSSDGRALTRAEPARTRNERPTEPRDERPTEGMNRAREFDAPATAAPGGRRSRIEASLVDEDEVVVKDTHDTVEEDPTEMRESSDTFPPSGRPVPSPEPSSLGVGSASTPHPDLVRVRGSSRVPDPAELRRGKATPSAFDSDPSGTQAEVELDGTQSAAVARRTFDARRETARARRPSTVQVKLQGGLSAERMQLVRRRLFVLLVAMLGAVAVGLWLSRVQPPGAPVMPGRAPEPLMPRAESSATPARAGASAEAPLAEILHEGSVALAEGDFVRAKQTFERALELTTQKGPERARAKLGRADALRALGESAAAIQEYRGVLSEFPRGAEAENARAALSELGVVPRPPERRVAAPVPAPDPVPEGSPPVGKGEAGASPTETAAEGQGPSPAPSSREGLPADVRCELIVKQHLGDPAKAIAKLSELMREAPEAPCVYLALSRAYTRLDDDRAALLALRRYLDLKPDADNRAAVEDRIRSLANKLEER